MFRTLGIWALLASMMCLGFGAQAATVNSKGQYQTADGEVLNDPTRPANWRAYTPASKKSINYTLNYILNARDRKQAIVNGKKVTVGDWVEGAQVISIKEAEVVLAVSGAKRVLRVNRKRASIKQ